MRNKKNRHIALLLATSLLINVGVLPTSATEAESSMMQEETQETSMESSVEMQSTALETQEPISTQQETGTQFTTVETQTSEPQVSEPIQQETIESTSNSVLPTEMQTTASAQQETEMPTQETTLTSEVVSVTSTEDKEAAQKEAYQQAIQKYLSMPVSLDRSMSLEWWYAVTGKVTMANSSSGETGDSNLVFPNSITVCSAQELILLSYVNPEAYATQTVNLSANTETKFDLTSTFALNTGSVNANLVYQGLGSFEHPFRGTVLYSENSEGLSFILKSSLFIGLSSEAKFLNWNGQNNVISLISKAENAYDGLLAQHVLGKSGVSADWNVRLNDLDNENNAIYSLPALFGVLYSDTNIQLTLTDDCSQGPSARGYICAAMKANAILEVKGIARKVSVPIVGELSDDATLIAQNISNSTVDSMTEEEFNELVEYYCTMTVIPGKMPLEWWFAVSNKLDELKEYLRWKETNGKDTDVALLAGENEDSSTSGTQTFDINNISKVEELINLSKVEASSYRNSTITITRTENDYDLKGKGFCGLGSEDVSFAGTFTFASASEETKITLDCPLFNSLSTDATVSKLNLVSATSSGSGGLLAKKITAGEQNELLEVQVNLTGDSGTSNIMLPAMVQTIAKEAKVKLEVSIPASTEYTLEVDANGFFCDTLEEKAELTVNYPDNMPTFDTDKNKVGGLVGTMEKNSVLTVEKNGNIDIKVATKGDNAGGLVGIMNTNASLTVTATGITIDVSTTGLNAGGLVCIMEDSASMNIKTTSLTVKRVKAGTTAKSFVGSLAATAVNPIFKFAQNLTLGAVDSKNLPNNETTHLTGFSVGGLIGKIECINPNYELNVLSVNGLKMQGNDCGGLFCEMENGTKLTIPQNTSITGVEFTCTATDLGTQSIGGLIGWYKPMADKCELIAQKISVTIANCIKFGYVGGMIGSANNPDNGTYEQDIDLTGNRVTISESTGCLYLGGMVGSIRNNKTYLKLSGTVINSKSYPTRKFGGLVAYADDKGHLIEVGDTDLTQTIVGLALESAESAGGLVGTMDSGVLYISGNVQLGDEMTPSKPASRGWVLGSRGNNVLVCSAEAWSTKSDDAAEDTNDTGIWGQVLQLTKFPGLVTLDSATHEVTICSLPEKTDDSYKISSLTDFAAVALRMQLNENGFLRFGNEYIKKSDPVKLTLENDIDLTGTGLTGLTKDNIIESSNEYYDITIVGKKISTEEGERSTRITLPDTTVYVATGSHNRQGLIAEVNDIELENLNIEGGSKVKVLTKNEAAANYGIANDVYGDATLTNVISSIKWMDIAEDNSSDISGMLTNIAGQGKKVTFKNCTWDGIIETNCTSIDLQKATGGFIAYNGSDNSTIQFVDCKVAGTVSRNKEDIAYAGGLIAKLDRPAIVLIDGLTVTDTINAPNATETGGLLGYQWNCSGGDPGVTIKNINIQGAEINAPVARFGGLVYKGSGYWIVEENGIIFSNSKSTTNTKNTFIGRSEEDETSGLLLADGFWEGHGGGLYLEVLYGGYKIEDDSVKYGESNFEYFDELVGKSIGGYDKDGNILSGIISIATSNSEVEDKRKIDQSGCNTYQDRTGKNKNTRYYYNLDFFRGKKDNGGDIDTSGEMVLWSAYNSCASNLKKFFRRWNTDNSIITGKIDLTGYSFYPVPFDGTTIQDAEITFDFKRLDQTEAGNKEPSEKYSQHAGMHTGIFSSVDSDDNESIRTLTIDTLTLSGTIGGLSGEYGAIVRGTAKGEDGQHTIAMNIKTVKLNGIYIPNVEQKGVAPLLISSIGSNASLNLIEVETVTGSYSNSDGSITKAASSLIGNVGDINASRISLDFSDIRLAESGKKNDKCTIFTHALFLERFQYNDSTTCQGTYNFRADDEYTLGREIDNTDSGRNPQKQYWFFGDDTSSGKIYELIGLSGEKSNAFADYPRYVRVEEGQDSEPKNHELDINLPAEDLLKGCGTYSDPYLIESAGQLTALQLAIIGNTKASWKINVAESVLTSGSFAEQDGHTNAQEGHVTYQYSNQTWRQTDNNTVSASTDSVSKYLRNAYYKIIEDITLDEWIGLGSYPVNQRFSGVIIGDEEHSITIKSAAGTPSQFGGLIAVSSGSVVKDITVKYEGRVDVGLSKNNDQEEQVPSTIVTASFFGGVVGWCIGGDTIIDNVSVDFSKATITAGNEKIAVGGYVGLVGGASDQGGGGVVFRGAVSDISSTETSYPWNKADQYYWNPYVGRVLDGYAISEIEPSTVTNSWPNNGDDNYTIPYLTEQTSLAIEGATVTVGNAEGLWLFSAMENSRHGSAYTEGKPRAGSYETIGSKDMPEEIQNDEKGSTTITVSQTDFYLWKRFKVGNSIPTKALTLNITSDCDMTAFGNGFRGIGVSYGTLKPDTDKKETSYDKDAFLDIKEVTGTLDTESGHCSTITLSQNRQETSEESSLWASMGIGLFPILSCTEDITIQNLTLAGTVTLNTGKKAEDYLFNVPNNCIGVGMLSGGVLARQENVIFTMDGVNIAGNSNEESKNAFVEANVPFVGGLIGYCGTVNIDNLQKLAEVKMNNCNAENIKIIGQTNIGGAIGFTYASTVTVENFTESNIQIQIQSQMCNLDILNGKNGINFIDGMGGVFGAVHKATLKVKGVIINGCSIKNTNINKASTDVGFGGLVGMVSATENSDGYMKNVQINDTIQIIDEKSNVSVGGLIGVLSDTDFNNWNANNWQCKKSIFNISDIQIGDADKSSVNLKGRQAGGLIGMLKDGNVTLKIGGNAIDSKTGKLTEAIKIGVAGDLKNVTVQANSFSNSDKSLGGLIGISCNIPTVSATCIFLQNIEVNPAKNTALILGQNAKAKTTLKIQNMEADNCTVNASENSRSGFIYGVSSDNSFNLDISGYNIMLRDCTIVGEKADAFWGGDYKNGSVQLVAANAIDCTGPKKDFASASETSYVIRANYTGNQTYSEESVAPWMPVNPLSPIGSLDNKSITGDGAAFVKGTTIPVGKQIVNDWKANKDNNKDNEPYYNLDDEVFEAFNTSETSTSSAYISTYSVAGGNAADQTDDSAGTTEVNDSTITTDQPNDFPVLVLPAVGKTEITAAVYNYISLLTNYNNVDATKLSGTLKGNITAKTYQWDTENKKFASIETCSLTIKNKEISVTTGCYDNKKNQFTLLDVSFADPTDGNNTYHLYIPVIVQKLMNFRFSAAASLGTNYYTTYYSTLDKQVLASHEEQVTVLLTFEYERSKEEWQTAIDNGENLLWNFDKEIIIDNQGTNKLPNNTKLTLVDRSNQNKVYYAIYDGESTKVNFNKVFGDGYTGNSSYICDELPLEATLDETGGYIKLSENDTANATLRIGNTYYRPATDNDNASEKVAITVADTSEDAFLLKEQFYLTIQTPKDETFVNVLIECANSLNGGIPNRRIDNTNGGKYTCKGNENQIVIGNFFTETVTIDPAVYSSDGLKIESSELVSETQNVIKLDVTSSIQFKSKEWFDNYILYSKNQSLYQRFDLKLLQWQSRTSSAENFASGISMDVKYYMNGDTTKIIGHDVETLPESAVVQLKFPNGISFANTTRYDEVIKLQAVVTLTYGDSGILLKQFIARQTSESQDGLQFLAYSHLSYSEEALERSSVSQSNTDNAMRFYRSDPKTASLHYDADGDISQRGINGRLADVENISSFATYEVKQMSASASSATSLHYSLSLIGKGANGQYGVNNIEDAEKLLVITDGTLQWLNASGELSNATISSISGEIDLSQYGGFDPNGEVQITLPLTVQTGGKLESMKQTYSNYKVTLTVSLYNGDMPITGSTAADYIIYTNAKIVTSLIPTSSDQTEE